MKNLIDITRTLRIVIPALLVAFVLPGCASQPMELVSSDRLTVERTHSRQARIGSVQARQTADELVVYGELSRRFRLLGRIPGHLHITVYDQDGSLLAETTSQYHRKRVRSRSARFSATLPITPGDAARVSVVHHRLSHGNG